MYSKRANNATIKATLTNIASAMRRITPSLENWNNFLGDAIYLSQLRKPILDGKRIFMCFDDGFTNAHRDIDGHVRPHR